MPKVLISDKMDPLAALIFRQLYQAENPVSLRLAGFRGLITAEPDRVAEILSPALAWISTEQSSPKFFRG